MSCVEAKQKAEAEANQKAVKAAPDKAAAGGIGCC